MRPNASNLAEVARSKTLFDAHCHYLNFMQKTEGLEALSRAMTKTGVGYAALTGCPFKKTWVGTDQPPPQHPLYDDGDLYYYSMTDGLLVADMKAAFHSLGHEFIGRFAVLACGFNLGDYGVAAEAERVISTYPCIGLGEVTLRTPRTLSGMSATRGTTRGARRGSRARSALACAMRVRRGALSRAASHWRLCTRAQSPMTSTT